MTSRGSRKGSIGLSAGVLLAIAALAVPPLVSAANITVNAIPGAGWIQSPDNDADAAIVAGPAGGLGQDSVKLTSAAAPDFVGIVRPLVGPLTDLTGGSWMTFATGDTGAPATESASLRFGGYQLAGLNEFTTITIELSENGGATPDVWQTNTFNDQSNVWQTNTGDGFCLIASPCKLADFKTHYQEAHLITLTVAIGTGVPPVTSYFDGVSVTFGETSDTWDFELAAAPPTAAPTAPGSGAGPATAPPTDIAATTTPQGLDGRELIVFGGLILLGLLSIRLRPSRPPR